MRTLAFSPDGRRLASGGEDHLICLWDVASGQIVRRLEAHTGTVRTIAFDSGGTVLGSGSEDGTSIVWDPTTGRVLHRFVGPRGSIDSVAFSPDGKSFAAGSGRGTALWDLGTGRMLEALTYEASGHFLGYDLDGRSLVFVDRMTKQVSFWNLTTRTVTRRLTAEVNGSNNGWVDSALKRLLALGHLDGRKISDAEGGKFVPTLSKRPGDSPEIASSPDGKAVAGPDSGSGGLASVWELSTGRKLQTFRELNGIVNALAFSPDGRALAAGNGETVGLWNVESGTARWSRKRTVERSLCVLFYERQPQSALSLIVGTNEGSVQVWDSGSGKPRRTIHDDVYRFCRILRGIGGAPLMVRRRGDEPGLPLIDVDSGATVGPAHLMPFGDEYGMSSDGHLLAYAAPIDGQPDRRRIIVSDFATGGELRTLVSRDGSVGKLTFSRDNRWLLSSSSESSALWDLTNGEAVPTPAAGNVELSPDGHWLSWRADIGRASVVLFSPLSSAKRVLRADGPVNRVFFSPNGRYLAAGLDGPVSVWEVETGRRVLTLRVGVAMGWSVFCPDERCILTGSMTKPLQLWDIATGHEMIPGLSRLTRWGTHSFSPDMRWLATSASDGGVEIWDVAARTSVASLYVLDNGKTWLVRTPSGFFDVSDDETAGRLITWTIGNEMYQAEQFSRQRHRPGLLAALLAGR